MKNYITNLLKMRIGFDINIFEVVSVGELEDGSFYVYDDDTGNEYIFDIAEEATDYFLKLRDKKELGLDYEIGIIKKAG